VARGFERGRDNYRGRLGAGARFFVANATWPRQLGTKTVPEHEHHSVYHALARTLIDLSEAGFPQHMGMDRTFRNPAHFFAGTPTWLVQTDGKRFSEYPTGRENLPFRSEFPRPSEGGGAHRIVAHWTFQGSNKSATPARNEGSQRTSIPTTGSTPTEIHGKGAFHAPGRFNSCKRPCVARPCFSRGDERPQLGRPPTLPTFSSFLHSPLSENLDRSRSRTAGAKITFFSKKTFLDRLHGKTSRQGQPTAP